MNFLKTYFPYFCMILCQLAYGAMNILIKIAMQEGLSPHVFVAYRHLLASAISAPVAYVFERSSSFIHSIINKICRSMESRLVLMISECECRKQRPPLSSLIIVKIFIFALVGITIQQNILYAGLEYTSPTVAGALSSVIPAFTFILALLLRSL